MYFFLITGIIYSFLSIFSLSSVFNEVTGSSSELLEIYLICAVASFAIFSLLSRIKTLEKNVDALWKIAEEKGYQKPVVKPDIYIENHNNKDGE